MLAGLPDWAVYVLLLVVASVAAGAIWRLACATFEFVKEIVRPLAKIILILGLWIVLILLVNKLELLSADFSHLTADFHSDAQKLASDFSAPLFAAARGFA